MSGVWVFKNGVVRLEVKPEQPAPVTRRKALVYVPADETVESHEALQRRLLELGWELYNDSVNHKIVQFRHPGTFGGGGLNNLITLPADFALVNSLHMHDIAERNPGKFEVVNIVVEVELPRRKRKALLYTPEGSVVRSYADLEALLRGLGWERYYEDPASYQFHRRGSLDLISLPADFASFGAVHMYDIVVKNRAHFRVVDI